MVNQSLVAYFSIFKVAAYDDSLWLWEVDESVAVGMFSGGAVFSLVDGIIK